MSGTFYIMVQKYVKLILNLLFNQIDDNWKIHRRNFSYSFTRRNLLNFVQIFMDAADHLVKNLAVEEGKIFSFYDYIFKCSLELHMKTLFKMQDYEKFENQGLNEALVKAYEK